MSSKRKTIPTKYRYHRPVLSEVLPFEVPPTFSNGGFFNFLTKYDVRVAQNGDKRYVIWECSDHAIDSVITLIFGSKNGAHPVSTFKKISRGKERDYRKVEVSTKWTIPYSFDIAHKEKDFRRLTVVHPRNQVLVANFYNQKTSEILYHTSLSEYSIRRPSAVATTSYFDDEFHKKHEGVSTEFFQETEKEYRNLGAYFTYSNYSNIFKFYEHYEYHNAEKKFSSLLKLDISKCFDSIYTHSLPWTVFGIDACKDYLPKTYNSFGGNFDALMRDMNRGETNGIVIGPEFSRIFAEIILQGVDRELEVKLRIEEGFFHKRDYRIFRYVDDYFIFNKSEVQSEIIERHLGRLLRIRKLNLNQKKSEAISKPIITPQTIAKNRISSVLEKNIGLIETEIELATGTGEFRKKRTPFVKTKNLIVEYKTVLHETNIPYKDLLNYSLAIVERSLSDLVQGYTSNEEIDKNPNTLVVSFIGVLEFCFFIFSAAPRVNFTVRLVRIITTIVDSMLNLNFTRDAKNQVCKYAHDNIVRQIRSGGDDKYRVIETMYLLLGLEKLGNKYAVPEKILASYFGITLEKPKYTSKWTLSFFSICVCLIYIKNKKQYSTLKRFLERKILEIFTDREPYLSTDTESLLLFLDLQCCPFISRSLKRKLAKYFLIAHDTNGTPATPYVPNTNTINEFLDAIQKSTPFWFTNWTNFDLSIALDNKRSREVY